MNWKKWKNILYFGESNDTIHIEFTAGYKFNLQREFRNKITDFFKREKK